MSEKYEPIPIPRSQKIREFRHRIVPVLVFLMVASVVFYLWDMRISNTGFTGKVVADSVLVTSPSAGKLDQFVLRTFDRVEKGEPIANIVRADTGYYQARLNLVSSMIKQVEMGMEPMINHQRNIMDYENIRLENMQTRIEVASLRIREQQLKASYERAQEVFEKEGISAEELDLIRSQYLMVKSEMEEKEKLTEELTERLQNIEKFLIGDDINNPVSAAIDVYEKELRVVEEELKPITIYAVLSGVISAVYKGNEEYVGAGDAIVKIEATEPSYILGYVRQPFLLEPEEGMEVEIRTRKPKREFFASYITRVGGHIEYLEPGMKRPGIEMESGLPVQIAIQNVEGFKLYPGEYVDVVIAP